MPVSYVALHGEEEPMPDPKPEPAPVQPPPPAFPDDEGDADNRHDDEAGSNDDPV